jgi:ribonuclease E
VDEGSELELKLVEVGLYDPSSAVAKQDGVEVVVADAAKLVGKKATVRVGRVLEGQAFATLVGPEAADAAITFESEAEKPTRAPRRKAGDEPAVAVADEPMPEAEAEAESVEEAEVEAEPEIEEEKPAEAEAEAEAGGDAPAPKKRTRRGSRGGRKRKKKPVEGAEVPAADAAATEGETAKGGTAAVVEEPQPEVSEKAAPAKTRPPRKRTPRIHVPAAEPSEQPAEEVLAEAQSENGGVTSEQPSARDGAGAPKKRTRRGSRGGRGRKPKAAAPAETDGASPATDGPSPLAPVTETVTVAEAPAEGYVPMSEWIDDLDR